MEIFLARQPIFDRQQHVYGYELLYRSGLSNFYDNSNDDNATASVLTNSFLSIGMGKVTSGKIGFINFTDALLRSGAAELFPQESLGIEVSNSPEPNPEIFEICSQLQRAGYKIILDDFEKGDPENPLAQIANVIKVDFLPDSDTEPVHIDQLVGKSNATCLAKKVETVDAFDRAVDLGYTLFQGYFFAKPVIMAGKELSAHRMSYLGMLRELNQPTIDFEKLENILGRDVTLTYKLLNYINSPFFGLPNKIKNIRHALNMIGLSKARQWLSLLALSSMGSDKSEELIVSCLIRARFFELIAPKVGQEEDASALFLMGLFSMIDALLDMPMTDILATLPLCEDVKSAILGRPGRYSDVYQLLVNFERGEWDPVCQYLARVNLVDYELPKYFLQAIQWSNDALPR